MRRALNSWMVVVLVVYHECTYSCCLPTLSISCTYSQDICTGLSVVVLCRGGSVLAQLPMKIVFFGCCRVPLMARVEYRSYDAIVWT